MSEVLARVRKIIADRFFLEDEFDDNSDIMKDLGADSLDMVELIMIFEEQFKIRVTDELASQIKTVKQAANAVETLLERKNKEG
jgi:acyl carrier protein